MPCSCEAFRRRSCIFYDIFCMYMTIKVYVCIERHGTLDLCMHIDRYCTRIQVFITPNQARIQARMRAQLCPCTRENTTNISSHSMQSVRAVRIVGVHVRAHVVRWNVFFFKSMVKVLSLCFLRNGLGLFLVRSCARKCTD